MSEGCIRKTLATFPYGNIQECSCGGYYVTFGYVTLRLYTLLPLIFMKSLKVEFDS
jgi:hypothetical protein